MRFQRRQGGPHFVKAVLISVAVIRRFHLRLFVQRRRRNRQILWLQLCWSHYSRMRIVVRVWPFEHSSLIYWCADQISRLKPFESEVCTRFGCSSFKPDGFAKGTSFLLSFLTLEVLTKSCVLFRLGIGNSFDLSIFVKGESFLLVLERFPFLYSS